MPTKLYSSEEFSRRGGEIYDRDVRPALGPEDEGKFVAIDIASGVYEIDGDDYTATERLLTRRPQAQIWLARIGQPAAYRIGTFASIPRGNSVFVNANTLVYYSVASSFQQRRP